jgi:DNA helicase-2/ATP-dependent DNA helicase PcrA
MSRFSEKHLSIFETQVLASLNPGQRDAVDHIEGPVMVIAGPGTGKTQLLAARIGNILRLTDTDPREILCLTYTEAGTTAMRKRLIQFLGPEGYRVPVYTFHGFCNLVIQENPAIFGGYREMQPITELEQRALLKAMINGLPPDHALRRLRGDYYYNVNRLAQLFDVMKREDFSPLMISEAIDAYLEELPLREGYFYKRNYKQFKAGDPKQAEIDKETGRMEETRVAAALLPGWQEKLVEAGRYDFSDMLRWVHNAFVTEDELLRVYQERFLYILVDEYQDTSGLQNGLLNQLASFWEEPNLFVVGDDDQAIYRFQGASMANILSFQERYRPHTVMLTANYRSSQAVLDSADALIEHNRERLNTRLQLPKKLVGESNHVPQPGVKPRLLEFESSTGEEAWIISRIQELLQSGVPSSQIAILYRNHRHAENLLRLCRQRGIPVSQQRKENILHDPFIQSLLEVLRYINGEFHQPFSEESRLVVLLHYRYFGIGSLDVARMLRFMQMDYRHKKDQDRYDFLRWRELLGDRSKIRSAGVVDVDAVARVGEDLEYWIKHAPEWTIQTLFEKLLTKGGVLQAILNDPQKRRLLELVTTLFDYIKNDCAAEPDLKLDAMLGRLDEMMEGNILLPYVHYIGDPEGVPFTTVHSAKGLEWRHVFMMACSASHWSGKTNGRAFKLPDTILRSDAATEDQSMEEERRLFFVGMTRAQEGLYISYSQDQKAVNSKKTGSKDLAAQFYTELEESAGLPIETIPMATSERENVLEALLHPLDENPSLLEEAWMREQVDQFVMSVTALNKYLACPRAFYYENILRVPGARNRFMGYGSAVHRALELLFRNNAALSGDVDKQLFSLFESAIVQYRSHFTDQEYENTLEHARQNLPLYAQQSVALWKMPVSVEVEKSIKQVEWQGYPISGKLDKVEVYPDGVIVVDYKTGNPLRARSKLHPAGEDWQVQPGGDYWRQMVFYNLLVLSDRSIPWTFKGGVMEFVEPNGQGQYERAQFDISAQDIALVSEQIAYAFAGIRNLEFQRGCHDPQCTWCQLVDQHILPESLTPGGEDPDEAMEG